MVGNRTGNKILVVNCHDSVISLPSPLSFPVPALPFHVSPFFPVFSRESLWVKTGLLVSLLVDLYPLDSSLCVRIHIIMNLCCYTSWECIPATLLIHVCCMTLGKAFNLSGSNKYQFIYNILQTSPSEMFETIIIFLIFFKVMHYINTK